MQCMVELPLGAVLCWSAASIVPSSSSSRNPGATAPKSRGGHPEGPGRVIPRVRGGSPHHAQNSTYRCIPGVRGGSSRTPGAGHYARSSRTYGAVTTQGHPGPPGRVIPDPRGGDTQHSTKIAKNKKFLKEKKPQSSTPPRAPQHTTHMFMCLPGPGHLWFLRKKKTT